MMSLWPPERTDRETVSPKHHADRTALNTITRMLKNQWEREIKIKCYYLAILYCNVVFTIMIIFFFNYLHILATCMGVEATFI